MMKDYMTGNWRNNALADMYRQPHVTMDIEQRGDGFGAVGGGLGGFRAQQPQIQPQQPQWAGIDQTQWQPQYAQPVQAASPYQAQQPQQQYMYANPLSSYVQPYQNALGMYSRGWG